MNRRLFLASLLAAVPLLVLAPWQGLASRSLLSLTPPLQDKRTARRAGEVYLQAYPRERDERFLRAELGLAPGQAPTRDHLALLRQRDFVKEDMVSVAGWLVSRSEARAMALMTLAA